MLKSILGEGFRLKSSVKKTGNTKITERRKCEMKRPNCFSAPQLCNWVNEEIQTLLLFHRSLANETEGCFENLRLEIGLPGMTAWAGGFREVSDLQRSRWKYRGAGGADSKVHAENTGSHSARGEYAYKVVGVPSAAPLPCCGSADVLLFPPIQWPVPRTWH